MTAGKDRRFFNLTK